jgi:hypothetical protein
MMILLRKWRRDYLQINQSLLCMTFGSYFNKGLIHDLETPDRFRASVCCVGFQVISGHCPEITQKRDI